MIVTLYKTGKDGRTLYYTVHDRQQTLISPYALTTAWRSGNGKEREKLYYFDSLDEMDALIRSVLAKRIKDGYRLLYSWSRDARWSEGEIARNETLRSAGLLAKAEAARETDRSAAFG